VKINFAVPVLEALGHSRLRFEHNQKDIVLSRDLPSGMAVVVETKRLDEPLDRHLAQLERYAYEERSLLAVITNGDEVRVYVPLWPGARAFADALLLAVRREELAHPSTFHRLAELLGAAALTSGAAGRHISAAQKRREEAWKTLASLRSEADREREGLEARLRQLDGQTAKLDAERRQLDAERREVEAKLAATQAGLARALDTFRALYRVPGTGPTPSPKPQPPKPAPAKAAKPTPHRPAPAARAPRTKHGRGHGWSKTDEWTDAELTTGSTDFQQRVLRAFVEAGQRTLGVAEIAASAGIRNPQAWGAARGFIDIVRFGRKEPLFETTKPDRIEWERRGVLITVVEKYWPVLQRLYGSQVDSGQ